MSRGGVRRQQKPTASQLAHEHGSHEPQDVERRLLVANKSLIQTEELGEQVRGEQVRGQQRRLLVAKESLIDGLQAIMLGKNVLLMCC